jgi:hypothetical protein
MKKHDLRVISSEQRGFALVANKAFKANEAIIDLNQFSVTNTPTYQTIQINDKQHLDDLDYLAYMNHSCDPNVRIDTNDMFCYILKDVAAGEELTFFYPSTEWSMAQAFNCQCGSSQCLGEIKGALSIPMQKLKNYFINTHILEQLQPDYAFAS